jgi:glycosyltransferase involved in cell wall biosynthesis
VNERIRILHCLRAPVGGLFRHVLDLSGEQAALGHDVGIVMDASLSDPVSERRLADIEPRLTIGVFRVPMGRLPGIGDATAAGAVRDLARAHDIDILHGHGAKGGAYARIARQLMRRERRRVVTVYTPHGGSLHYLPASPQGALYTTMEKVLARFTDGLIFESAYAARLYERRVGKDLVPTRVITNALQPADFAARVIDPDAADFLFVGELRHLKGVDVLLRALARIAASRPVSAVIVGAGAERDALEALSAELGLERSVSFTGAMPAPEAFRRGRCIVVPSRNESLPYIVLEAAAAGIPLIATDVGGIGEVTAGSDTALIPADDVEALARAMQANLDDPAGAQARALRLRELVRRRFAVAATTAAGLAFYGELLGR